MTPILAARLRTSTSGEKAGEEMAGWVTVAGSYRCVAT
jgi:hypothetical protein